MTMPNLAQHAALAESPVLQRRLQAALVQRAASVLDDARPTTGGDDVRRWAARRRLAANVLSDPTTYVQRIAWQVAGHPDVLAALTSAGVRGNVTQLPDEPIETALDAAIGAIVKSQQPIDDGASPPTT